jgi:competence protein ComEA
VIQQPGNVSGVQKDKGSESVEVRKQTTRVETEKESIPTVEEKHVRADINRMDLNDFVALGVPQDTARSIVQFRDKNGKFRSLEDLRRVPGVSEGWLSQYRDRLAVG